MSITFKSYAYLYKCHMYGEGRRVKSVKLSEFMMVFSQYTKKRILFHYRSGKKAPTIQKLLKEEDISASVFGIRKFIVRYDKTGTLLCKHGSGTTSKITPEIEAVVEGAIENDDETTSKELQRILRKEGHNISVATILRCRRELGWAYGGTKYCQMIRQVNAEKRLIWAKDNLDDFSFDNVIFTDETTVQIETHCCFCCYKRGQKPRYKPRPKHPIKVHVWAGISRRGRTNLCIFEGKMNAPLYVYRDFKAVPTSIHQQKVQ